jgi:NAD(P)H-flavin reductase/ferredoxin
MAKITIGGRSCESGTRSVLDSLLALGVEVPWSCRAGICQACLMRAVDGPVPARAQAGLNPGLLAQRHFLACSCYPEQDLEVALPGDGLKRIAARVTELRLLSSNILGVWLKPAFPVDYHAGQFIRLYMDAATSRPYSLASRPAFDDRLELHVRRVPGGLVSGWLFDRLRVGDEVSISEPMGNCMYVPGSPEQSILLIGTGSGLAPLSCIAQEAIMQGHQGQIHLYHGARDPSGIYLTQEMRSLAETYANFHYVPCLTAPDVPAGCTRGRALDHALQDHPDLSHWRVYLCGNPDMVRAAQRQAFLAGASTREIFADAFAFAAVPGSAPAA